MSLQWMVIEQLGCTWAIPARKVARVEAAGAGCTLDLGDHRLAAEVVLGTPRSLQVLPVGRLVRTMVPPGCTGLSVFNDRPVVVVDPDGPPSELLVNDDVDDSCAHEEMDDAI